MNTHVCDICVNLDRVSKTEKFILPAPLRRWNLPSSPPIICTPLRSLLDEDMCSSILFPLAYSLLDEARILGAVSF